MKKLYNNEISVAIDLILDEYDTYNAIEIAELLQKEFGFEVSIPTVESYLSLLEPDRYRIEMENNAYYYYY